MEPLTRFWLTQMFFFGTIVTRSKKLVRKLITKLNLHNMVSSKSIFSEKFIFENLSKLQEKWHIYLGTVGTRKFKGLSVAKEWFNQVELLSKIAATEQ